MLALCWYGVRVCNTIPLTQLKLKCCENGESECFINKLQKQKVQDVGTNVCHKHLMHVLTDRGVCVSFPSRALCSSQTPSAGRERIPRSPTAPPAAPACNYTKGKLLIGVFCFFRLFSFMYIFSNKELLFLFTFFFFFFLEALYF